MTDTLELGQYGTDVHLTNPTHRIADVSVRSTTGTPVALVRLHAGMDHTVWLSPRKAAISDGHVLVTAPAGVTVTTTPRARATYQRIPRPRV